MMRRECFVGLCALFVLCPALSLRCDEPPVLEERIVASRGLFKPPAVAADVEEGVPFLKQQEEQTYPIRGSLLVKINESCVARLQNVAEKNFYQVFYSVEGLNQEGKPVFKRPGSAMLGPGDYSQLTFDCERYQDVTALELKVTSGRLITTG